MSALRARVEKGRLVLDEPTTLPEGTVVDLVADDEGDDLKSEERRALHEALLASWKSAEAGRLRPTAGILGELRPAAVRLPVRTCSLPKMSSGANAFEISDFREDETENVLTKR
jgi:hypothetical protein